MFHTFQKQCIVAIFTLLKKYSVFNYLKCPAISTHCYNTNLPGKKSMQMYVYQK